MFNVNILVGLFVVVLAINLLKGGGAFPSPIGIVCGSQNFWIANAIMLGWIILISIYCRTYLVKRFELKQKVGYKYIEGDIQWDSRSTIIYPCICCLAGFFAGMFGSKYCKKTTTRVIYIWFQFVVVVTLPIYFYRIYDLMSLIRFFFLVISP
jgi:hypothetical protein